MQYILKLEEYLLAATAQASALGGLMAGSWFAWLCQTSFLFNLKHGGLRGCALPPSKSSLQSSRSL